MLYHATRDRFISSIRKGGLRPKAIKSYEGQIGEGLVYFATDMDCAASYVECADNIPDSWEDDNIVVLGINERGLNGRLFCKDPNIIGDSNDTIAYRGSVPPGLIWVVNFRDSKIEKLSEVKRLSSKYYYN